MPMWHSLSGGPCAYTRDPGMGLKRTIGCKYNRPGLASIVWESEREKRGKDWNALQRVSECYKGRAEGWGFDRE